MAEHRIMILKRPVLSAMGPGRARPKIDAALRMARMCGEMEDKVW
jgi:hypothetical protein